MKFTIGPGSSIHLGCRFNLVGNLEIGSNSTINQYCHIDNRGSIIIGDNVSISPMVSLVTADHDMRSPTCDGRVGYIYLRNNVFVGYGALILKNVEMSKGSVLGARSVLTKDVPPYCIFAGVPAKQIGARPPELNYSAKYDRLFW